MRRLARIVPSVAALLLLTLLAASRVAIAAPESTCVNGGQENKEIAARKTVLQRSPTLLGTRIELANLLEKAGCYDEAVHLLEEGQKYNPFNPTLQFGLRRARNLVKEEHHIEGVDQAEASARLNRKMERCTREREVAACDEVLSQQPNNTKILIAKGDALVEAHRPAEASKAYLRASELAPNNAALTGKLQALQAQRQALKDAIALAARGSSLVTLGRAHEALARMESTVHKELPTQVAAISADAEAMVEPQNFSNVAEATRSN